MACEDDGGRTVPGTEQTCKLGVELIFKILAHREELNTFIIPVVEPSSLSLKASVRLK